MYWRKKMLPLPEKLLPLTPTTKAEGTTDSTAKKKGKAAGWQDILPVHSVPGNDDDEEGVLVLADGSMRKIIACKPLNVLLADEEDKNRMAKEFATLADSLNCDIQIIVSSRNIRVEEFLSLYQRNITTENEYLKWCADYQDKWFRRVQDVHFVPQREFYVVVAYHPPDCRQLTRNWRDNRSLEQLEEYTQDLNAYCKTIFDHLHRANLSPQMLTRKETRNLIYAHLNPSLTNSESDADAAPSSPGRNETELLARSALKISENHLWLDGKFVGTQYLQHMPQDTWFGWLVDLLTLPSEYSLSFYIHRNPDSDAKTRDNEKTFDISLYIKTYAESTQHLDKNMEDIRHVFRKKGAVVDRAQMSQIAAWQSTLPIGVDKMETSHRVSSQIVGSFWPFFTAMCGSRDGVPFGFAVASREPVLLNPFSRGAANDAGNIFITGEAGSGKSFAATTLISRLLPLGVRFVVCEKSHDKQSGYRFLTQLLGQELAEYIELGPSSAVVLNPFDLGPEDGKESEPSAQKIDFLLSLFELMIATEEHATLSDDEKDLLTSLINLGYREETERGSTPIMSDIVRLMARTVAREAEPVQKERQQQVLDRLRLFTRAGEYGIFLDGTTNIKGEKLLRVFDIGNVHDTHLEQITSFALAEFMRRNGAEAFERKQISAAIFDETATLMKVKTGACFLSDLSARAPLYNMLLITTTKTLQDFFCHPEQANSILIHTHNKILMRQNSGDAELLKEKLHLTLAEKICIEGFEAAETKRRDSQALLIVGDNSGSIRLVPSPMDYWACTSESNNDTPKRLKMIDEIKAKNPTINNTDACRQAVYYLGLEHN